MKLPMRSRVVWIKRSAVSKPQFVVSGRREQHRKARGAEVNCD